MYAALDEASKQLEGYGSTTKKGKKEDAVTKATRPGGKKFGMTALEAFAREEAKNIPALAEAINRREEMQRAVDQDKNVSSRALKRSSKKDNLSNGGKLSTKQNRVYEGRQLVGKRFCSSPSHGDSEWRLHEITSHVQKSTLRTDAHNERLRKKRKTKAPDAQHGPGMNSMVFTTRLVENDGTLGEDSNHDGDGDFTTIGWDEDYLKAKVELWKTGKGKDPQHYVDYQAKADDGAGPDAGAVTADDTYLPDENDIRASYTPAGKHSRA